MNDPNGMSRDGSNDAFRAAESRKSRLINEARLLREQQQFEASADRFVAAAELEEVLAEQCADVGLSSKANLHRFSAASCLAQAGNFYQAIALCGRILNQTDSEQVFMQRVSSYRDLLQSRRNQWYGEIAVQATSLDG